MKDCWMGREAPLFTCGGKIELKRLNRRATRREVIALKKRYAYR